MWLNSIFRDSPIPQLVLEPSGRIRMANPAAQALVGRRPLSGVSLESLVTPRDRPSIDAFVEILTGLVPGAGRELGPVTIDWQGTRRRVELRGSPSGDSGDPLMLTISLRDVTTEAAPGVPADATRDQLTRVPGRIPGLAALADAVAPEATGAVFVIDLDGFEDLNATFGFDTGDLILAQVAARMRSIVPPGTHLARIDGDMFLVVAPGVPLGEATTTAGRLLGALVRPIQVDGSVLAVRASIGIASLAATSRDSALAAALRALGVAKERGGGQVVVDTPHQRVHGRRRTDVIRALMDAEEQAAIAKIEARTDPLTGLPNRRRLDEDRQVLQVQARASGRAVAAIYIDFDEFGSINRARGDDAGDHALTSAATIMQDMLRAEDGIYRKGGEEFIVLLTDADEQVAMVVAERMRVAVESAQIPHGGTPARPTVTISLGVAAGQGPQLDLWRLTGQAEGRMRLAKHLGRNLVVGPPDGAEPPPDPHGSEPPPDETDGSAPAPS
ncbi:MAG: diguanylate cyclase [Candidatus Nanopelagicales bacterium]|jgi:diguanylate cyclase (GGDEF)-like protein/PAS domain S-box-containing protein|nr:diguanylate cyclase [Candidatus Nanopelagicales bacterium]